MRHQAIATGVLLALGAALIPWPAYTAPSDKEKIDSIRGRLIVEEGKPALLRSNGKDIRLSSNDEFIAATFGDTRISGREMKLEGRFLADGSFEIHKFYVIRAGSLYRLIYFCDT